MMATRGRPRKRDFKAEYAKRIARAQAVGKTRQQARGHHAQEHIERAEKEREQFGITRVEITRVRTWAYRRAISVHYRDFDPEDVVNQAMSEGYEWFIRYRDTWNNARREYLRQQRNGTYASMGSGHLEFLASIPPVYDLAWMYYH
jgi:hypothetical protein